MGPNGIVLFALLFIPILVLTGIALLWRKRRTLLLLITIIVATGEVCYLVYQEDSYLHKWHASKTVVDQYLEKKYPRDEWISMQEDSFFASSNIVKVVFFDEPHVTYLYMVKDGKVSLTGGSEEEGYKMKRTNDE